MVLADVIDLALRSSKIQGTYTQISGFFDFPVFLVFSLCFACFLIYILRSPKTLRPNMVKMFKLCNQACIRAIPKITKKKNYKEKLCKLALCELSLHSSFFP